MGVALWPRAKPLVEPGSHIGGFICIERVGRLGRCGNGPTCRPERAGVLVYLFRDENSRDTFAYSTDVTGRSIPRTSPRAKWSFVAAASFKDLDANEEARRHLSQHGIYVFRRPH